MDRGQYLLDDRVGKLRIVDVAVELGHGHDGYNWIRQI